MYLLFIFYTAKIIIKIIIKKINIFFLSFFCYIFASWFGRIEQRWGATRASDHTDEQIKKRDSHLERCPVSFSIHGCRVPLRCRFIPGPFPVFFRCAAGLYPFHSRFIPVLFPISSRFRPVALPFASRYILFSLSKLQFWGGGGVCSLTVY
jgi:hypothetical protein